MRKVVVLVLALAMLAGCARRKKYENPITTNSQQPDKVLFDRAIADIERSRFEVARLVLQNLINTYPDSEYIAKSKLAIADSWYRQGGTQALAQAEAEYKDFITFFPGMEEAAESQMKICQIHYQQMEKPDRDALHAVKGEAECRQLLLQFPNSKFVAQTEQMLREIQEVLAEGEYRVGRFYTVKGSYRAAATRLGGLSERYPLYSKSDDALWALGDAYGKMGQAYQEKSANAYSKLVREYPLSAHVPEARDRLSDMGKPIPDPDEGALARMKFELENRGKVGLLGHAFGVFGKRPNVRVAAKSGQPPLVSPPAAIPEGVPVGGAVSAEVGAQTISGPSALDTQPDARSKPPGSTPAAPEQPSSAAPGQNPPATGEPETAKSPSGQSSQPPTASKAKPDSKSKKNDKKKKNSR